MPLPFFNTGRRRRERRQMESAVSGSANLRDLFLERAQQPLTQSATFQTGMGTLRDVLSRRAQQDASSAAARGLTGGEFEIAQAANRNQLSSGFLRNLFGQAGQAQQASFGGALQSQGMFNDLIMQQAALSQQRRQHNQQLIAAAVQSAVQAQQQGGNAAALLGGG